MSDDSLLGRVSAQAGIEPFYWDVRGVQHFAGAETQRALLAALGLLDPGAGEEDLARLESELIRGAVTEFIPPVVVLRLGGSERWELVVHVIERYSGGCIQWRMSGEERVCDGHVELSTMRPTGHSEASGEVVNEYRLELPAPHAPGYYSLCVDCDDGGGELIAGTCEIIAAPRTCFVPESPGRAFGVSLQISSLVSDVQLGIGDFGDLREAVPVLRELGVDAIGVNPLHGLFEGNSQEVSPYSPSSRLNRNVLLLSIRDLPEWQEDEHTRALVATDQFQRELGASARQPIIPFSEVYRLKGRILELLGRWFREEHQAKQTPWGEEFSRWMNTASEGLTTGARFSALRQWLLTISDANWGWPAWPVEYRDPLSPAVDRFCTEHQELVDYHLWLQWSLDRQLGDLQRSCRSSGMRYGLYLDLALGAGYGGAETWANQAVYAFQAGAGAPPDELGPQGQTWGLPPYKPAALRQRGYRPFTEAVRAAMRHAGVLRLDHIMSLCRLFWIPEGETASNGAYVRYPLHDLLGIIALESVRNGCMIIGEDLGTVPDEVRAAMHDYGILSYKVLYFMNEGDSAVPPSRYPEDSLVVTSTHDLPTLWSFWEGRDIELRDALGLFDTPEIAERVRVLRDGARRMFCNGLASEGLWDGSRPIPLEMNWELCRALHQFLARASSRLQMVQIEDLLGLLTQVNVPGTTTQHPNWRYRLPCSLDEVCAADEVRDVLSAVRTERERSA